ncbi:MAG TPA: PHP domain-containing protein [Pseudonocardiaceae bacterium]
MLPSDGHVHSEWSWDAPGGSMERTRARAVELGLPCIAFTEHADFTPAPNSGDGVASLRTGMPASLTRAGDPEEFSRSQGFLSRCGAASSPACNGGR